MTQDIPDLLTGTELCLVAEVPGAGGRWQQVHFNIDVVRQFFNLDPGSDRSITLERLSSLGRVSERASRQLIIPESNRNARIEFSFGQAMEYPPPPERPVVIVVEAGYLTYRYRTLMPGDEGHESIQELLASGLSIGRGVRRRIVTLDDLESFWPNAALRGAV